MYVHDPFGADYDISNEVASLIERHDTNLYVDSIRSEVKEFKWNDDNILTKHNDELAVVKFFRELNS